MDKHYITGIKINKLRHLDNILIDIDKNEKKHLLLTGKNGVGKTTLLQEIKQFLRAMEDEVLDYRIKGGYYKSDKYRELLTSGKINLDEYDMNANKYLEIVKRYGEGIEIEFSLFKDLDRLNNDGNFILAYYSDDRSTKVDIPNGVENIKLQKRYSVDENPSNIFVKYLIDLKTQQSFARNEGEMDVVENIEVWFNKFENALKDILDNNTIKLKFDYRNYDFKILQEGRKPYGFNELSSGYSSIINIISDLILRMDKNRASVERSYGFDTEGIVLIDELETHLHIDLQKKILPFLTSFFPNIQFIVTTHSPFVLNSIKDAVVYDLEKSIRLENLSNYSYDGIVEGYFEVDNYSDELKKKLEEYRSLIFRKDLSDDERARRSELRIELKDIPSDLAKEVKAEFNEIEETRKRLK